MTADDDRQRVVAEPRYWLSPVLSLIAVRSRADVWIVFVGIAAYGIEATLMDPAEDALFAELFTVTFRRRLIGWRLAIQETGRLLAPLLGAALFVLVGGGVVAALDAATFVLAAATLTQIGPTPPPAVSDPATTAAPEPITAPQRARGVTRELAAGARHILATPPLRTATAAGAAILALSAVGVAAQYSLVHGIGEPPAFLGVLSATLGGASVLASLVSGRLVARVGEPILIVGGLVDFAIGTGLRATHSLPLTLAGSAVLGFALPWAFLGVLGLAQRMTPDALQGRVSVAITLALFGPQAPLQVVGSLLIAHVTYGAIYLGSAAVALGIAAAHAPAARAGRLGAARSRSL